MIDNPFLLKFHFFKVKLFTNIVKIINISGKVEVSGENDTNLKTNIGNRK